MKPLLVIAFIILIVGCQNSPTIQVHQKDYSDPLPVPTDSTTLYFPLKRTRTEIKINAIDSFMNNWYSEMLFVLKEPVLFKPSKELEIYRFTWLRTFDDPISIRIQKEGNQIWLIAKRTDGSGGYSPGKLILDSAFRISNEQWAILKEQIKTTKLWTLPTERDMRGSDGAEWIFEGVQDKNYHFITRWSPEVEDSDHVEKLGRTFIKLSGVSLKEQDIY